jgi:hypothetical protein
LSDCFALDYGATPGDHRGALLRRIVSDRTQQIDGVEPSAVIQVSSQADVHHGAGKRQSDAYAIIRRERQHQEERQRGGVQRERTRYQAAR